MLALVIPFLRGEDERGRKSVECTACSRGHERERGNGRRTVPQSFNHRDKRSIERVAVVVYAYSVYVEHPGCFVWVDGEGGEGKDVGSVDETLNLGWRRVGFRREGSRDEIICGDEDVNANGEKVSMR